MKDLNRMADVPFDDPKISMPKLMSFATDNLERMKANNAGHDFDGRIPATASAIALVETHGIDDETKLALRKARKKGKDDFRAGLPAEMAKIAGAVTAKYGADSQEMVECFPLGRTIFSSSTDDILKKHLQTVVNGVTAHAAGLGAELLATVTGLVTEWDSVHGASEEAGGVKTSTQEAKKFARENLQLMLFLNLLKAAEICARQPERMSLYMTQSLLESHSAVPAEPPTPPTPSPTTPT